MHITDQIELLRVQANSILDLKRKSALGQFFTPMPIAQYMASLFKNIEGDIELLDAGCGVASLTFAFIFELAKRKKSTSINVELYEIDKAIEPFLNKSMELCRKLSVVHKFKLKHSIHFEDFILSESAKMCIAPPYDLNGRFTHVIINPPYKKIAATSDHRKALRACEIETVNLYAGFLAMAIKLLRQGGELVAIVPRSFTNGPYYQPFRELLLSEMSIQHIHIFDSRTGAFKEDSVLQENIIIHCIKNVKQENVMITSSPTADFHFDAESGTVTATDMTVRKVEYEKIISPDDNQKFIHIATSEMDQYIIDRLSCFNTNLSDLKLQVSTGPIVDFRLKEHLRIDIEKNAAPLLYPIHMNHNVDWPKKSKKSNAIMITEDTKSALWKNEGYFVITRRFTSKDEKRRIVATLYDSSLSSSLIGFENGLNVFHFNKMGMDKNIAKGLFIYLNCTLLDKYYRQFGGHTQVNSTDLRMLKYPTETSLERIGSSIIDINEITQEEIDILIDKEIELLGGTGKNIIMAAQKKIDNALEILELLGLPKAQQNERSALTLLALLNIKPNDTWENSERPMIGVTPIMDWVRDNYNKQYAPNTRETFRRQTLHQFVSGGLCLYNPDQPNRAVTSPHACYQIPSELHEILIKYGTNQWTHALKEWLSIRDTLVEQYAKKRDMEMIPLMVKDGTEIRLSPGIHSKLIKDIIDEFGPRFAPGSQVIYVGDTGEKTGYFEEEFLASKGVTVDTHGKMPDVVLYYPERDWLLLIESVTSHGPVDGKRHGELSKIFENAVPGIVYVTAFPDRKTMSKFLADISWETEVWVADAPTHMIHFNGDRFLGPHT